MKDTHLLRSNGKPKRAAERLRLSPSDLMQRTLPEELFLGMLCLERKRAERSRKTLLLVLLDAEDATKTGRKPEILRGMIKAADAARRETDPAGWYKDNSVLGIIFTELGTAEDGVTITKLLEKVQEALASQLTGEDLKWVRVSMHVFADDSNGHGSNISANPTFYPDLLHLHDSKKIPFLLKRIMDIVGSLAALLLLSPLYLMIAVIIKLTSKGPVFFAQQRLGQFGKSFTCLKFRSMYHNNDLKIHREFMKGLIRGKYDGNSQGQEKPVYKMTNDPRITLVGRVLRRTSLDELPQFINVLKGDMSLVGPRPEMPFIVRQYNALHRQRLQATPGITGLWQLSADRSYLIHENIQYDLYYLRNRNFFMDLAVLLHTFVFAMKGV